MSDNWGTEMAAVASHFRLLREGKCRPAKIVYHRKGDHIWVEAVEHHHPDCPEYEGDDGSGGDAAD